MPFQGPGPTYQGVSFVKKNSLWVATVAGYTAEGTTKRRAQNKLKEIVPPTLSVIWVGDDSPFFRK